MTENRLLNQSSLRVVRVIPRRFTSIKIPNNYLCIYFYYFTNRHFERPNIFRIVPEALNIQNLLLAFLRRRSFVLTNCFSRVRMKIGTERKRKIR